MVKKVIKIEGLNHTFTMCLLLKAKSWTNGSEPVVPSFALMYLKTERGRPPQIVWTGKANNSCR